MTTSNWIELVLLIVSIVIAAIVVRVSNQKVKDIDGLGEINKQEDDDASVIAHF